MRDQEQRVVHHVVERRRGQDDAGEPAEDECHHEGDGEQHGRGEPHLAAEHGPDPVIDLHAGRHADRHRGDAERGVDVGTLPHGEEMVQPDREGEDGDRHVAITSEV